MAINIVGSSTGVFSSTHQVTLPPNLAAGQLIVAAASSYNGSYNFPSAWTQVGTIVFGTGTYGIYMNIAYRIVQSSSESGQVNTLTSSGANYGYSTFTQIVIEGHHPTDPIPQFNHNASVSNGTTSGTEAIYNTTYKSRGLFFVAAMGLTNVKTTINNAGGDPLLTTGEGSQLNYMASAASTRDTVYTPGQQINSSIFSISQNASWIGRVLAIREGNNAPQVTSMTPGKYAPSGVVTSPSTFNWTYSDVESNAQYKYEISYREAGTSDAYTTFTSANAVSTTSHTFAANTFVDGKDYEWRLRLDDNQGGGWSTYYTDYFTAGKNTWSQNIPKTTSTQSGVLIENNFPYGTFENASDVNVWKNNNFFGTYADTTSYAISTTRAKSGTSSLKVVFPTSSTQKSRVVADKFEGFKVGSRYLLQADVFVETGGPDVKIDAFLQDDYLADTISTKNQWVEANCTFTANSTGVAIALATVNNSTAGTVYMDNVRVYPLPNMLEPGNYELQVRTADAVDFGPWSTSSNFTVKPPTNVYTFSGGAPVQSLNYVRINGVWVQAAPTKRMIGGVFQ